MQFNQVQLRPVTFVLAETIFGKTRAEVAHNRVSRHFRDHAGRGNTEAVAIAVDDRRLRKREWKNGEAIDQDVIRPHPERFDGGAHRLVRGAENIDRVDLNRIDDPHGPRDRLVRDQVVVNFFAPFREKLLGIVQPAVLELFWQNDGRCYNRAGQRAAPCFIDAGDRGDTDCAQSAFIAETTAAIHWGKILKR
jgi:hypothetical protein